MKNVHAQNLQNPAEIFVDSMNLIETGNHEVDADSDPDLGLHGVLGCAIKGLDPEVLLDPFKEQLDMPTTLVDAGNGYCGQPEMVGNEDQTLACFWIDEADSSEFPGVIPFALGGLQADTLVATQATGFVNRAGFADVEGHVALGPRYEECSSSMNMIEPCKIDVSTIHDIDASRFENDSVKNVHVVDASVGNVHEHWDRALQIDHRMQFDRGFGLPEMRPREHRKAKVNCRGIECVNHLLEIESIGIFGVQSASLADEDIPESFVDPPIPIFVRIREIRSDDLPANAHRVAMSAAIQASFDIPQTLPKGDLGEGHGQKLIASGHTLTGSWHGVQIDAAVELFAMDEIGDLGKNQASGIHPLLRMNSTTVGQHVQMRHMPFYPLSIRCEQDTNS